MYTYVSPNLPCQRGHKARSLKTTSKVIPKYATMLPMDTLTSFVEPGMYFQIPLFGSLQLYLEKH